MECIIFLAYYWAEGFEFWFWFIVFIVVCSRSFIQGLKSEPYEFWSKLKPCAVDDIVLEINTTVETEEPKHPLTEKIVIDDALSGLAGLGYKKREVSKIVSDLVEVKQYEKPEDLIRDVFEHAKK